MPSEQNTIEFAGNFCISADVSKYPDAPRANGYFCPLGPEPGIGYVLITRKHWDLIQENRNSYFPMVIRSGARSITFPKLYIVSAVKVSGGPTGQKNAAYLLKLTDKRWHARMSDVAKQINIRCPAPPAASGDDLYYEDSLNSGTAYTWTTAAQALWTAVPGFGSFPGLPSTPDGQPEGFHFVGRPAIDCLCELLDKIGCTIAYNPVTDAVSIVSVGSVQQGLSSALSQNQGYLLDAEPFDVPAALVPHTIRVYFHRKDEHYGSEKFTKQGTGNWVTSSWYKKDIATGHSGAIAGTVVQIWDDLPALYDPGDSLTNSAALDSRAAEVAANWLAEALVGSARRRTLYQGIVSNITPGSQIKSVHWRNFGDGLVTEVANHPGLPKSMDTRSGMEPAAGQGFGSEALSPADLGRHSYPHFPPLVHLVRIGGDNSGDLVGPTGDNLWSGQVLRVDPTVGFSDGSPYITGEDIWISVPNLLTGSDNANRELPQGERFFARLSGSASVDDEVRPHYSICRPDNDIQVVTISAPVSSGGSATVTLQDGRSVSATNIGEALTSGTALAFLSHVTSQWFLLSSKASSGGGGGSGDLAQFVIGDALSDGSAAATDEDAASITVFDHKNLFLRALTGAKGVAVKDENDEYVVVECESQSGWVCVELTEEFTVGVADAILSFYGGTQQDVQEPPTVDDHLSIVDEHDIYKNAMPGSKAIGLYDNAVDQYIAIICDQRAILALGTLAEDMAAGDATVDVSLDEAMSCFPFGQKDASVTTASNIYGSTGFSGDRVLLIWSESEGLYHLIRPGAATPAAQKIYKAKLNGALSGGSTATIDTVTEIDGGGAGPTITSASNYLGRVGADDDDVLILVDGSACVLLDVKSRIIDVQTNTVDATTELDRKYRSMAVNTAATTDSTSKIADFGDCT